jgi:gamma-glutamylcyclotransferase (GGCT)/AIG2-like uncharacterized protein YtfP
VSPPAPSGIVATLGGPGPVTMLRSGSEPVPTACCEGVRTVRFTPGPESPAAHHRLATYGTLAPGRPNHDQLAALAGRWLEGQVYGRLVEAGWGADLGFPALVLDPGGTAIDVQVLESADLPAHWSRLDQFEGPGYDRVVTTVRTANGDLEASIYVLHADHAAPSDGS